MASTEPEHLAATEGTGEIALDGQQETDSAYAESTHESDTTSLKSSIRNYRWHHGRRYHSYGEGEYWGPNDDEQLDNEDFGHQMFIKILKDNLFVAPIGEDPQRILDIGTGSGIWAIDVADQYPSAEVIGVDISPVQPSFVPPNCRFELDDATQPWTFQENHFDFIHIRMMNGCVPDWTAFYRQALKHIRPGGWFEQVELSIHTHCDDGSLPDDSVFHKWAHLFIEIGQKIGRTFEVAESAPEWLKAAGFVNVTNQTIKVPLGPWAKEKHLKELGLWSRVYLENNLEGFALKVTTMFAGWSVEEAQVFFAKMRKSLRDPSIHSYIYLKVVTGQKANE